MGLLTGCGGTHHYNGVEDIPDDFILTCEGVEDINCRDEQGEIYH